MADGFLEAGGILYYGFLFGDNRPFGDGVQWTKLDVGILRANRGVLKVGNLRGALKGSIG